MPATVETREIPLELLHNHPDNPDPTEAEVLQMMQWLTEQGQAEPIHVRPLPLVRTGGDVGWEVLAGKTRLAAATRLGWVTLRAEVHGDMDDLQAAVFAGRSNLERRTEGTIRTATWLQALMTQRISTIPVGSVTDKDRAEAIRWAGEQFGLSESATRNKLRFLKLPEPWRSRLQPGPDGEPSISERVMRALLPYAEIPQLMEAADKEYRRAAKDRHEANRWRDEEDAGWMMTRIVEETTGPIDGTRNYGYELGYEHPAYFTLEKLDAKTVAKLQIVEIPDGNKRNATRRVALNLKEYLRINTPLVQKEYAKKKAKAAGQQRKAAGKPRAKSPAELEQEQARKAELLTERIRHWRHRRLLWIISGRAQAGDWQLQRLWLLLVCCRNRLHQAESPRPHWDGLLKGACEDAGLPVKARKAKGEWDRMDTDDLWQLIVSATDTAADATRSTSCDLSLIVLHFCRRLFSLQDRDMAWPVVPYVVVDQLAKDYAIDLADDWRQLQGSAATKTTEFGAFCELFDREQLASLVKEWGMVISAEATRKSILANLQGTPRTLPVPKCLAQFEKPAKKAKARKRPAGEDAKAPELEEGVCRICGCTEEDGCATGCVWTDATRTLCTACVE